MNFKLRYVKKMLYMKYWCIKIKKNDLIYIYLWGLELSKLMYIIYE